MITVFNASNYAQQVFFNKAFAELKSKGNILNPDELAANKFLSLDGYFAHMNDLVTINRSYVLIPSDEQPFEIDANTRSIKVPAAFSKCSGVVGDNMCEIITFTVDRYFDYVDLANTNICIQWELGNGDQGISHIGLRDLETVSGKIRFGWPLTSELTEYAGNITFSIRFFITKTVEDDLQGEKKQFVYLLNTLPASIPIKKGLIISGDDVVVEESVEDLFVDFISNSNNPSYPIPKPVVYTKNLPAQEKIDPENNTLILSAQATAPDNGYVKYKWYLKEGVYDKSDLTVVPEELISDDNFDIRESYVSVGSDLEKLPKDKTYYINTGSAEAASYMPVMINPEGKFVFEGQELVNTELFERFSVLEIKDTDYTEVTGLYYVEAWNEVGTQEIEVNGITISGINKTNPLQSTQCYVPTPAVLIVADKGELPANKFIDSITTPAIIAFNLDKDSGNPQRTYTWYKADGELEWNNEKDEWVIPEGVFMDTMLEASGPDKLQLATTTPGWYRVHVNSLLNRATTQIDSKICRIVNKPSPIEAESAQFAFWTQDDKVNASFDTENAAWTPVIDFTAMIKDAVYGDIIRLQLNVDEPNSLLLSDSIRYEWYVNQPDVEEDLLITDDSSIKNENGIIYEKAEMNKPYLDVRCTVNVGDEQKAYSYYCKIINTLNGESISSDDKNAITFLVM